MDTIDNLIKTGSNLLELHEMLTERIMTMDSLINGLLENQRASVEVIEELTNRVIALEQSTLIMLMTMKVMVNTSTEDIH